MSLDESVKWEISTLRKKFNKIPKQIRADNLLIFKNALNFGLNYDNDGFKKYQSELPADKMESNAYIIDDAYSIGSNYGPFERDYARAELNRWIDKEILNTQKISFYDKIKQYFGAKK
jgi:hypothetical protein